MNDFSKLLIVPGKLLPSRRNTLSIIYAYGELAVRKEYQNNQAATIELINLTTLLKAGIHAPMPLFDSDNTLFLTYEEGPTYELLLQRWEVGEVANDLISSAFKALCHWFFSFYIAIGKLKGDVKLHNFIYNPKGICIGLDFEEPFIEGQPELELGCLIAHTATCSPALTPLKKQICLLMLSQCLHAGYKVTEVRRGYFNKILEMGKMRPNYKKQAEEAIEFFNNLAKI